MTAASLENPIIRQAIQTAFGVGAAVAAGTLISGQRWYWAVIAAFIVAIGVGSRGEAAVKALQRVAGTLIGLAAGIALAFATGGNSYLAMGLVLACVFFAFYAFQAAYGTMIFFITIMLALLYGIIGKFTPVLLLLRLEETAAGAAIGLASVYFVLPIRQDTTFAAAARAYRQALAQTIRGPSTDSAEPASNRMADLQAKTQSLRTAVGAAKRGWAPLIGPPYRDAVRAAMRCTYLVRETAHGQTLPPDFAETLATLIESGQPAAAPQTDLQAALADAIRRLLQCLNHAALAHAPPPPR